MAQNKLNVTQRRFVLQRIQDAMVSKLNKQLEKDLSKIPLAKRLRLGIRVGTDSDSWADRNKPEMRFFELRNAPSTNMCGAKKQAIEDVVGNACVDSEWRFKEYEAGNYEVDVYMEPCYTQPRVTLKFTNEAKEVKRIQRQLKKTAEKEYDEIHVIVDQARADVLALNKWLRDTVLPKVMLTHDGEGILNELLDSSPL